MYEHRDEIKTATEQSSVITVDRGVKALSVVAGQKEAYRAELLPWLLAHLKNCRPKDVPQRAEAILKAVDSESREQFIAVVQSRMAEMQPSQEKRLRRVIAAAMEL